MGSLEEVMALIVKKLVTHRQVPQHRGQLQPKAEQHLRAASGKQQVNVAATTLVTFVQSKYGADTLLTACVGRRVKNQDAMSAAAQQQKSQQRQTNPCRWKVQVLLSLQRRFSGLFQRYRSRVGC